jgi:pimeloyl-ACP methyl ester carboxylesterase
MRWDVQGRGPTVIKIAGLVGGVQLYREEMAAAVAGGLRVVALDISGDRADDPAIAPHSWATLSDEVIAAADACDAKRPILWGTSFGCLIALATAARWPERVGGLVLAYPPAPGWRPELYGTVLRWAQQRQDPERSAALLFRVGFLLLNSWEFAYPTALRRLPRLARASFAAATPASTILRKLELMWQDDPGLPSPHSVPPSAILAGRLDAVALPSGARRLAERLPRCRLHVLPRAGHAGSYSHPRSYRRWAVGELQRMAQS